MKQFDLYISEEHKQAIRDGATHVLVEWTESERAASGSVTHAGTETECGAAHCTKLVVLPHGITAHAQVWDVETVKPLLEAAG